MPLRLDWESGLSAKYARSRLWALNKQAWRWMVLGLLGAIVAGATAPCEGVFIAQVQVHHTCPYLYTIEYPYALVPLRIKTTV